MALSHLSIDEELRRRLDPLLVIGQGSTGTTRLAWSAEQREAEQWFQGQADESGLLVETDPAGNLWARPDTEPPWTVLGSHLDTVEDGGLYDGALGVAAAFQIAAQVREPAAVVCFADEEGARFNTPTFGSRALIGQLELGDVLRRVDRGGRTVYEALIGFGLQPARLGTAPDWLSRISRFIEIHVDQTAELRDAEQPVGLVAAAVARKRVEVRLRGRADHAGATPIDARRDALLAAAHLIVDNQTLASEHEGMIATATRIEAEPNALTTVPHFVRLWLDARAPSEEAVDSWAHEINASLTSFKHDRGIHAQLLVRSSSRKVEMDADLLARLGAISAARGLAPPRMLSFAGHDACVLAQRIPAAMVMVRNRSGISHAPEEALDFADAAIATELVAELCRQ